jgi:ABC-type dipeptide/oligopeptide/nickel transport system permease component
VTQEIRKRFADTAILAVCAMGVAIVFAIPLGIVAAVFRGRFLDHAAMTLALAGISMPSFWLGPLLAILFASASDGYPSRARGRYGTWCCPPSRSGRPCRPSSRG